MVFHLISLLHLNKIIYVLPNHNKVSSCMLSCPYFIYFDLISTLSVFPPVSAGRVRSLSTALWSLTHLTALHLSDNSLSRIPPDIAKLHNLVYLDLSSNKIRSLPAELGNMVSLRSVISGYTTSLVPSWRSGSHGLLGNVITDQLNDLFYVTFQNYLFFIELHD